MRHKRLQNRVAESRFAFPVVVVYAALAWMAGGVVDGGLYLQFAMFAVSALAMVALNNNNSLIRIYSRMVSCSFLVITCAAPFLFPSMQAAVTQTFFILFLLSLMRIYQDKKAPGVVFYSFACLGVVSLWFVQILYYVPVLWLLMAFNLMAFSHRMLWASVLGVIVPYWFLAGYYAWNGQIDWALLHFARLGEFGPLCDITRLDTHRIVTFVVFVMLAVIAIVHYLRNSYLDKIRTRMIYEIFVTLDLLTIAFLVLQPQHYDCLMPIIAVNTSCLFAHFIALTKTRFTNIVFCLVCIGMLALTAYNLFFH